MTATTLILCAYRGVSTPTHHAIVQLMRNHPEWDEVVVEQAPINRARSFAASQWYRDKPDEDVFLMVDDDILFEPDAAVRLVELCRNGHDIIGAAYSFRDGSGIAMRPLPGDRNIRFGTGEPPREVRHIGTGFFAVHRRVLGTLIPTMPLCSDRQMATAFWPFFQDEIVEDSEAAGGYNWLTEDYFIADRARELGFKVWLDPSIFLAHYGQVPVTLTNREAVNAAIKGTFADTAPAPPEHPARCDCESCNTTYGSRSQRTKELAARMDAARDALADEWNARNPRTPAEIAEFYRTSERMADDLEAWHATPGRQQVTAMVVQVARQIGAKVALDIGCGMGHELRALKTAGVLAIGVEPNERMRAQLQAEGFPVIKSLDVLPETDLLICLDVLEHVPDPEKFLADIADSAKQKAVLIESTATFDEGTPLHLEQNRGWHPTNCLESRGWELLTAANRVRVWQKLR